METVNVDRAELLRQLSFIKDPVQRLKEYVKYGLKDLVWQELDQLVENSPIYFQYSDRATDVVLYTESEGVEAGQKHRALKGNKETVVIVFMDPSCSVTAEGLQAFLGWSKEELTVFVNRCLEKAIKIDPRNLRKGIESWAGSWEISATARAFERFMPKEHKSHKVVNRWLLTAWLFDEVYLWFYFTDEMYAKWLGAKPREVHTYHKHADYEVQMLERQVEVTKLLAERLKALDMSAKKVERLFADWLIKYGAGGLDAQWLLRILCSGLIYTPEHPKVEVALQTRLTHEVQDLFKGHNDPRAVVVLARSGMAKAKNAHQVYKNHLAKTLASGKIVVATIVHSQVKDSFGLSNLTLKDVAAEAADSALKAEKFGIVAAIVNQFGVDACIDPTLLEVDLEVADGDEVKAKELAIQARRTELLNAAGVAQAMGQAIEFDLTPVFVPKY